MDLKTYLIEKHNFHRSKIFPDQAEFSIDCPDCGKDKDHFNFNIKKRTGACFKCTYSVNDIELIARLENINLREAKKILVFGNNEKEKLDEALDLLSKDLEFEDQEEAESHENCDLPEEFELIIDALRKPVTIIPKNFDRNYPVKILQKFELGFCREGKYAARIIFPIYTKDKKSFVARKVHEWMKKKYKNPTGSKHSQLLYGYNFIPENAEIFLCEGPTDVLRLASYKMHALATFGKKISNEQVNLLFSLKPKEVISLFDGDAVKQNVKAFEKLSLRMNASYVILPKKEGGNDYYDPDDIPINMLKDCIDNRIGLSKLENAEKILNSL